jgi:hypothetical protein
VKLKGLVLSCAGLAGAGLLTLTGCGILLKLLPGADAPIVCVAQYEQINEQVELGTDGCGNEWLRIGVADSSGVVTSTCWLLDEATGLEIEREIACPAAGDTIAVVP